MERPVHLRVLHNPGDRSIVPADGGTSAGADAPDVAASPQQVIAWALERFPTGLVTTTGFGMEGCVMIDMLWRITPRVKVYYLDTHFLFAETHRLRERLVVRYPGLELVNAGTSQTPEQQEREYGAALWQTDPDRCCDLRKVQPMRKLLVGAAAWMTALRRSQSAARAAINLVDRDPVFGIAKINPLAAWSREEVWEYAIASGVPYNELHEQGYPTIGCTHCTRAVPGAAATDYTRAGRWAGTAKTECGLHWNEPGAGI